MTNSKPQVTVLMTVYNAGSYLREAIDSILNQSFGDYEFLIVDDASKDSSWHILEGYAATDKRINIFQNEKNIGNTLSTNRLLAMAQGEFITRQDNDDISHPTRLARQVEFLTDNPEVGLVSSRVMFIDEGGRKLDLKYYPDDIDNETLQQQLLIGNCFCHGSVMFRKKCSDAVGLYDQTLDSAEDYDLWLRMAEVTKVARLPADLYLYRIHSASSSTLSRGRQLRSAATALERAMHRRYGSARPTELALNIARRYLDAAGWFHTSGNLTEARHGLVKALVIWPAVFDVDETDIKITPTVEGVELINSAVVQTPATMYRWRVRSRFLAALYMREVFTGLKDNDLVRIDMNLWPGLRHNPLWLGNRGVLRLVYQLLIRRFKNLWSPKSGLS